MTNYTADDYKKTVRHYGGFLWPWLWSVSNPVEPTPPGEAPNIPNERSGVAWTRGNAERAARRAAKRWAQQENEVYEVS